MQRASKCGNNRIKESHYCLSKLLVASVPGTDVSVLPDKEVKCTYSNQEVNSSDQLFRGKKCVRLWNKTMWKSIQIPVFIGSIPCFAFKHAVKMLGVFKT